MFALHLVEKKLSQREGGHMVSNDHNTRFSEVNFPLYEYFSLLFIIRSEAIKTPNEMAINTACLGLHWQKFH